MPITCAADVHQVFEDAIIDHEELNYPGGVLAYANSDTARIDGHLTWQQIEAIAYWRAHLQEFKPDAPVVNPRPLPVIQSADDVRAQFPESASFTPMQVASEDARGRWHNVVGTASMLHTEIFMDGHFTPGQILALAYWLAHPREFALPVNS